MPEVEPTMRRVLLAVLLVAAPLLAPISMAHEEEGEDASDPRPTVDNTPVRSGYTGPSREPYLNYFEGSFIYGQFGATPLGDQVPRNIRGSGDWLVWEDSRSSDIYAFNIPAGVGQYITRDTAVQRNPAISDGVIVWEDYRNNSHTDIYAYFLDTGEMRRVSSGPGNHQRPSVDGRIVAWEDTRNTTLDIWGYDLVNRTQFPIVATADRESDPLVLGENVYYRTYRFNVWDIFATNLTTGESSQITADLGINGAPYTNGKDVFFLTQFHTAWSLDRYDEALDRVIHTKLKFQDTTFAPISGENLVQGLRELGYHQLVAENVTTGLGNHVSGNLLTTTPPWLEGRTAYVTVRTTNGSSLLSIDVSPFAFSPRPTLQLLSPRNGAPWNAPIGVEGILKRDGAWSEPATFTYRVDGGIPQAIPSSDRFRFTLDPAGVAPGRHEVTLRATFREGPPVEETLILSIPRPGETIDVEQAGEAYHAARVFGTINQYFVQNPVSYLLVLLVLILVAIVIFRLWLVFRPRRKRVVVEYVRPREQ